MAMKKVVIDGGHGGPDPGAVSRVDGKLYMEKHLAWDLATRVVQMLRKRSKQVTAELVPHDKGTDSPNPLRFRNRVAKAKGADIFISIHWNGGPITAYGTESWYKAGDEQGCRFGEKVGRAVSKVMSGHYRGTFPDSQNRHRSLGILTGHTPGTRAALLEVDFISHPSAVRMYLDAPDRVATAIVDVILEELKL